MHTLRRSIVLFFVWPLGILILLLGLLLSGIFALYQTGVLESWVTEHFKNQLTYSDAHTSWYEWDPKINLNNLTLISPTTQAPILKIQTIQIEINLWRSLWHFTLVTDQLKISGMDAHFSRTSDGQWSSVRLSSSKSWTPKDAIRWLLLQKNMAINQVNLYFPGVTYSDLELAWTALSSNHRIFGHVLAFNFNFQDPLNLQKSPGSFHLNITWTRPDSFHSLLRIQHWATLSTLKSWSPYYRLIRHSDFNFKLALEGTELQPLFVPLMFDNFPLLSPLNSLGGSIKLSGDLSQGVLENIKINAHLQHLVLHQLLTIKNINFQTEYENQKLSSAHIALSEFNLLGPNLLFSQAWPSMDIQAQFNWSLADLSPLLPRLSIQDLKAQIHTDHFDLSTQGPTQDIQNIPLLKQDFLAHWG